VYGSAAGSEVEGSAIRCEYHTNLKNLVLNNLPDHHTPTEVCPPGNIRRDFVTATCN
jgi:hypothetical protein